MPVLERDLVGVRQFAAAETHPVAAGCRMWGTNGLGNDFSHS